MDNQFWGSVLPVCLGLIWLVFGAGIAYYYWLKNKNQKAENWLFCSLLILCIISFIGWISWGIKSGVWIYVKR